MKRPRLYLATLFIRSAFIVIASIFGSLAHAQTPCATTTEFGSKEICLPELSNHYECLSNAVSEMLAEAVNAPGNVVLGLYLNEPLFEAVSYLENARMDDPAWESFDSIPFEDYHLIYATKMLAEMPVDTLDLRYMAEMSANAFETSTWDEMKTIIENKLEGTTMSKPKILERYQPHPAVRSMVILLHYESEGKKFWKVGVINMMVLRGRIINSAYYLFFKDQSTIEATKKGNDAFIRKLMKANP